MEQRWDRIELYEDIYDLMNKYYFRDVDKLPEFKVAHEAALKDFTKEEYEEFRTKMRGFIKEMFSMKRRHVTKDSETMV